jgi:hypothetical protein
MAHQSTKTRFLEIALLAVGVTLLTAYASSGLEHMIALGLVFIVAVIAMSDSRQTRCAAAALIVLGLIQIVSSSRESDARLGQSMRRWQEEAYNWQERANLSEPAATGPATSIGKVIEQQK